MEPWRWDAPSTRRSRGSRRRSISPRSCSPPKGADPRDRALVSRAGSRGLTPGGHPAIFPACRTSNFQTALMHLEISDDRTRVDVAQLLDLYRTTWWAHDRSHEQIRRALDHSHPVVTAWDGATLVGFARVISDLTYRATIWDVIVRPSHQGRGVGSAMMNAVLEHPD